MPTRIRLQRYGKKGAAYYHLVIADGRAPREGKFIEKIGTYNPLTRPATIDIDFEKALHWVNVGASPTDTVRAILSYKGVIYKAHLLKGVAKGALTVEQAEVKFQSWLTEKEAKIKNKANEIVNLTKSEQKKKAEAELKVKEAKINAIAEKNAKLVKATAGEEDVVAEEEAVAENKEPQAEA